MKQGILAIAIVIFVLSSFVSADENEVQVRINNIYIDQYEVFDSTQSDWFFLADFLNSFHSLTKRYIIEDELLFAEGDYLDIYDLEETERNLRKTELFTKVKIEIDSINEYYYDVDLELSYINIFSSENSIRDRVYSIELNSLRVDVWTMTGGGFTTREMFPIGLCKFVKINNFLSYIESLK